MALLRDSPDVLVRRAVVELEDPRELSLVDADPVVAHPVHHLATPPLPDHLHPRRVGLAHVLAGVVDQVVEDMAHLGRLRKGRR